MDKRLKDDFLDLLFCVGALKTGGDFTLKSGRISPYFFNVAEFNTGSSIHKLGQFYGAAILDLRRPSVIFGPSYKGVPLAVATSIALEPGWGEIGYAFDRKEAKDRGEATQESQKSWIVGSNITNESRIIILDDVITTGAAKYEALDLLKKLAPNATYLGVVIALDRQEVGDDGKSALETFSEKTGLPVHSLITATDIYERLKVVDPKESVSMARYLRAYGTEPVKLHVQRSLERTLDYGPHLIEDNK